ncbi:retropepsin-like aspartic protease [Krasilnikovia sp. MM14-A1259]|uniref:retropepsin-like aspartic protease n=1 Tax=Krasilnikovia sp. MM14-A1259 TaxID=3373539 RepID=UPI00381ABB41
MGANDRLRPLNCAPFTHCVPFESDSLGLWRVDLQAGVDSISADLHNPHVITSVEFDRVQHLIRVPIRLGGNPYRFLVDTGIGVTVVSSAVAAEVGVQATGDTYTARRMSGQAISSPLVRLPLAAIGGYTVDGHLACIADLGEVDGPDGFAGILGLDFFHHTITIDPDASTLTVQPADSFPGDGYPIPLDLRRDAASVDPFATMVLPSGRQIHVEIDTGSANLILDTRLMPDCGIQPDDPTVTTKTGTDETGHPWTRHWATVHGDVYLEAAPQTAQAAARVQFQDIIHDGLVGTDYLHRYRVTIDLSNSRLILHPRL